MNEPAAKEITRTAAPKPAITLREASTPSPLHAEFAGLLAKMQAEFGPQKTIAILRRTVALLKEQS